MGCKVDWWLSFSSCYCSKIPQYSSYFNIRVCMFIECIAQLNEKCENRMKLELVVPFVSLFTSESTKPKFWNKLPVLNTSFQPFKAEDYKLLKPRGLFLRLVGTYCFSTLRFLSTTEIFSNSLIHLIITDFQSNLLLHPKYSFPNLKFCLFFLAVVTKTLLYSSLQPRPSA